MLGLTLVRHASTAWNEERRYQGWSDLPLSPRGREEARRLGDRLRSTSFDRVVASDLRRCLETAELALPGARVEADARLRELGFGAWEGLTYDECLARSGERLRRWISDPTAGTPPDGERFGAFADRIDEAVAALPRDGSVLVVTHGGPIRRIVARALGLDWARATLMEISACGIVRLALRPDGGHLLCWNDTSHLELG